MRKSLGVVVAFVALSSANVAPAQEAALPEGRGKDKVVKACGTCHEINRVTNQRRTKAHWAETVDDMVARGAQVEEPDFDDVVAYLSTNFSPAAAARP